MNGGSRDLRFSRKRVTGTHSIHLTAAIFNGAIDVESVTLEDVLHSNNLERIDCLKMHCEGAEFDILAHAPPDVLDRIGTMLITHSQDGTKIADVLTSRGFTVTTGQRSTLRAVNSRKTIVRGEICLAS